ncbi:undecaprenyl/decaprenyl-phosphate alpha-N-acetylglucosaminyl 1-phosphate transferase [Candidatus Methylopumilus universalis]|uniref:MraY family glycosyltransferase n=1 Tax=Candidatus Methylopumilus universalis TaxID=2588536 RepID=UPI00111E2851|nr:MraY family glycosyltransferase [Candidatus Methylopumilus universalis]QDC99140.1 undecaprenyl/decaprenyl-phosphate alpha-N-acetylglucosaminyl 1-phosphate transferase [Candidatus Methylopumilus universalis]
MNFNVVQWFDFNVLIFMGISLVLNVSIIYLWHKKFYQKLGLKSYQAIQRIHLNETPRLGGLVFILSLASFVMYCPTNESIQLLKLILICLIPIIIIGVKEDLFHNVEPAIRLLALLFSGWLFIAQFNGPVPNLTNIPLIGKLLALQGGFSFFYILSMVTVANGMNLVDGVNGLCGAVVLSTLGALLFLSYKTSDEVMLSTIFSTVLILIPFLILNYPNGKIFLGDLGAYSLGLITSLLTIILFGRHPEISPWGAVLILIYPATEVIFSLLRRTIMGVSIYHPDTAHLHLKFFYFYKSRPACKKMASALVTPTLSLLWLFPLIAICWGYPKSLFIWIAIILFMFFYGVLYTIVTNLQK